MFDSFSEFLIKYRINDSITTYDFHDYLWQKKGGVALPTSFLKTRKYG